MGRYRRLKNTVVIGLGTGRCGTTSLTTLFNKQDSFRSAHELCTSGKKRKPVWGEDFEYVLSIFNKFYRTYAHDNHYVSDIGFYWLPYVDDMMEKFEDEVKFVCVRRNIDTWVKTYVRVMRARNYMVDNPKYFKPSPWDGVFPSYDYSDFSYVEKNEEDEEAYGHKVRVESAKRYWTEYYKTSGKYQEKYPNNFKIFEMEEILKDTASSKPVFDFIGIKNPIYEYVWVNLRFGDKEARLQKIEENK